MSILFVLTCLMPLGIRTASANIPDESASSQPDPSGTLYCYSDYEESLSYCQALVAAGVIEDYRLEYCFNRREFYNRIERLYEDGEFMHVRDSYVIFEMRSGFEPEIDDQGKEVFADLLSYIFAGLKGQGCQIMFICGTDETRFENHNDFLDYVDIHINVDIFYTFIANVFYQIYEDCDNNMQISDLTFLLDASLYPYNNPSYSGEWFVNNYFYTYFLSAYQEEAQRNGWTGKQLLEAHNIQTICHSTDGRFHYMDGNGTLNIDSFLAANHLPIYAIGTTYAGETYSYDWIRLMIETQERNGMEFPVYVYDGAGYNFDEYRHSYVYVAGIAEDIFDIMRDFLDGEDMSPYANWSGRCVVTYKAISSGSEGWMRDLSGESIDDMEGWQIYLDEENFEYYTNGVLNVI